jgi:Tfp pilus assembly protein PilW
MAEIDINQMIADALYESKTRVGIKTPEQMQLMSDTLKTAGGVYGNQLTAENNRDINDINQQTTDLAKKNSLNYNAPATKGVGGQGTAGEGQPLIPSATSPGIVPRGISLGSNPNIGTWSTTQIGDFAKTLKRLEGGM